MNKKFISVLILIVMLMTCVPVTALSCPVKDKAVCVKAEAPVVFEKTITVTEKGGKFDVGFVTLQFKKDFLPKNQLPAKFNVKVYVKDGQAGVEVTPDTKKFNKDVLIKVSKYEGYLYDKDKGKNVYVKIKSQVINASHFSWYRFR